MTSKTQIPHIGYKKILYTTDLSETGREAFPHAASLAHTYDAELTVLHVIEAREFEKFLDGYINDEVWEQIKTRNLVEARDILVKRKRDDTAITDDVHQFIRDAEDANVKHPYVTYEVVVDMGDPVHKIVEHAHVGDYDLVIIGKHGHTVFDGGLMGDTARRVIRGCRVPVMVVHVPDKER